MHRGNALYFQQKFEECYQDYEKALELNPDLSEASERLNQFRKAERRKQIKKQNSAGHLSLPRLKKSMSSNLITEQTSRPVVPRSILVARKREIQANKDLYNLWEFPDTSHLLKDPLLTLMANGGKGPTKLRNEHKYKGDRESTSNKRCQKLFDHKGCIRKASDESNRIKWRYENGQRVNRAAYHFCLLSMIFWRRIDNNEGGKSACPSSDDAAFR